MKSWLQWQWFTITWNLGRLWLGVQTWWVIRRAVARGKQRRAAAERYRHNTFSEDFVCVEVEPNVWQYTCTRCWRGGIKNRRWSTLSGIESHLADKHLVNDDDKA